MLIQMLIIAERTAKTIFQKEPFDLRNSRIFLESKRGLRKTVSVSVLYYFFIGLAISL